MQGRWTYVVGGILVALLAFYLYRKYRVAPGLDVPHLAVTDLQGNKTSLHKYAGKPMVLSFAASWCAPCMKELRELSHVSNEVMAVANVVVVSDEEVARIAQLRDQWEYPFEFLKLEGGFSSIGINSIPTTYFFNAEGVVVKQEVGYIDWADASNRRYLLQLMSN